MSRSLVIRPAAENDMLEGRSWHEAQRPGLGIEFLDAIDDVFDRISRNPDLYAPEYKSVRRARLHRFSYVVYYRLAETSIEVIAVIHGSRSPRIWRSRI